MMFTELEAIVARPAPFCTTTAALLWGDPHTSEHMLRYHLDGAVNLSSRTTDVVDRSVDWLIETLGVGAGVRVLDLGCGPGLYSNRLAAIGAKVTGVDLSASSLRYAAETAPSGGRRPVYIHGNHLDVAIPGTFDIALMIFCDFCALSPVQRGGLLERLRTLLGTGGRFVFDVHALPALSTRRERNSFAANPAGGFWSPNPYFEFVNSFVYQAERLTLDRFDIIEADRHRTVYNWLQHFDVPALEQELHGHGFDLTALLGEPDRSTVRSGRRGVRSDLHPPTAHLRVIGQQFPVLYMELLSGTSPCPAIAIRTQTFSALPIALVKRSSSVDRTDGWRSS
jgi:SAM-dependent methyltransferase